MNGAAAVKDSEAKQDAAGTAPADVRVRSDPAAVRFLTQNCAVAATLDAQTIFIRPDVAGPRAVLSHEYAHIAQLRSGLTATRNAAEAAAAGVALGASRQPGGAAAPPMFQGDVVADLDRSLKEALNQPNYPEAAKILNRFSADDIKARLAVLPKGIVGAIHQGALDNPLLGANSNAALLTASTWLDLNFNNAVAVGNWQLAAEYLNAYSRDDILAKLPTLGPVKTASIHQGALDNPRLGENSNAALLTAQSERGAEPAIMGGSYDDYKNDPDYVDNFSEAQYDAFSRELHLFFPDGGEALVHLPLQSPGGITFVVFTRRSLLSAPSPKDFKIYPTVLTARTVPNIASVVETNKEAIEQSDLMLEAGTQTLRARSVPEKLWWLPLLGIGAGMGARMAASRMKPSFGEEEEILPAPVAAPTAVVEAPVVVPLASREAGAGVAYGEAVAARLRSQGVTQSKILKPLMDDLNAQTNMPPSDKAAAAQAACNAQGATWGAGPVAKLANGDLVVTPRLSYAKAPVLIVKTDGRVVGGRADLRNDGLNVVVSNVEAAP